MNDNNFSMASVLSPTPTVIQQRIMTPGSANTTLQHSSHLSAFSPIQPVLTPRETPRGTSMCLVLLSPSRTITETLNALASSTAQQLEEIWDEVGYTPQERASQLSDLLEKFRSQCEQKISEEQGVAETFRQTIADSKVEIKTISDSLKELVDTQFLRDNNGEMTLTDELENRKTRTLLATKRIRGQSLRTNPKDPSRNARFIQIKNPRLTTFWKTKKCYLHSKEIVTPQKDFVIQK